MAKHRFYNSSNSCYEWIEGGGAGYFKLNGQLLAEDTLTRMGYYYSPITDRSNPNPERLKWVNPGDHQGYLVGSSRFKRQSRRRRRGSQ